MHHDLLNHREQRVAQIQNEFLVAKSDLWGCDQGNTTVLYFTAPIFYVEKLFFYTPLLYIDLHFSLVVFNSPRRPFILLLKNNLIFCGHILPKSIKCVISFYLQL